MVPYIFALGVLAIVALWDAHRRHLAHEARMELEHAHATRNAVGSALERRVFALESQGTVGDVNANLEAAVNGLREAIGVQAQRIDVLERTASELSLARALPVRRDPVIRR